MITWRVVLGTAAMAAVGGAAAVAVEHCVELVRSRRRAREQTSVEFAEGYIQGLQHARRGGDPGE